MEHQPTGHIDIYGREKTQSRPELSEGATMSFEGVNINIYPAKIEQYCHYSTPILRVVQVNRLVGILSCFDLPLMFCLSRFSLLLGYRILFVTYKRYTLYCFNFFAFLRLENILKLRVLRKQSNPVDVFKKNLGFLFSRRI